MRSQPGEVLADKIVNNKIDEGRLQILKEQFEETINERMQSWDKQFHTDIMRKQMLSEIIKGLNIGKQGSVEVPSQHLWDRL